MKHIKLFEHFETDADSVLESVFQVWKDSLSEETYILFEQALLEGDELEQYLGDEELTSGEKRAMGRDMQIISKPQLAALYLFSLGKEEEEPTKFIFRIPGMKDFAELDMSGKPIITSAAFADAIGLESLATVSRTVNKFRNMLSGVGEIPGEVTYPKIIRAFQMFSSMNPDDVVRIAEETIQDPAESVKNREAASMRASQAASARGEEREMIEKLGYQIFRLITELKRNEIFRDIRKAQNFAIRRLATETGLTEDRLAKYYKAYLQSKGILNKLNFAE